MLGKAVRSALEYEKKVLQTYQDAMRQTKSSKAKRFFKMMADDERRHVEYLEKKLQEWQESGSVSLAELTSALPRAAAIAKALDKLKAQWAADERGDVFGAELENLRRAAEVEAESVKFYRSQAEQLPAPHRELFQRFLEIEEGHEAIVRAEIDAVESFGFWFDLQEFNQELD